MSLLDELAGMAGDKGAEGIEELMDKAKDLAGDHLDGPEADLAKTALDKISARSEALAHLGQGAVVSLIARIATGEDELARQDFLRMNFADRIAASEGSSADTVRDRVNRERYWYEVQEMIQDLGKMALKILPFLIAAV